MARYGATAPQRQWTAQRLLNDKGWRDGSSRARDDAMAPQRRRQWTAQQLLDREGRATAPRRRGTARRLLDGEGWRDGSSTVMAMNGVTASCRQWTAQCGGDGPRAQQGWAAMDGAIAN